MKRREGARNRETKTRGEVTAIFTESASQSVDLDLRLKCKVRLRYVVRALENLDFSFPPGRLSVHPMQVKGWIWN